MMSLLSTPWVFANKDHLPKSCHDLQESRDQGVKESSEMMEKYNQLYMATYIIAHNIELSKSLSCGHPFLREKFPTSGNDKTYAIIYDAVYR
jgi:hypothetical protein